MISQAKEYEGPRLIRGDELIASERLSRICFGDLDENDLEARETPVRYRQPRRGGLYVITHQGVPVSQIHTFHYQVKLYDGFLRVGSIGGVCTHPDHREKGLAGRLMEYCTDTLAREGARLISASGGRGLYTRLGCVPAGKFFSFIIIKPKNAPPPPSDLTLQLATSAHAVLCSQLYHTEAVHFIRQPSKFIERLGSSGGYVHAEAWVIFRTGRPVAYLLLGIPWEYLRQPDAGVRYVREYAGSRTALVSALGLIMSQSHLQEIHFPVAWQDEDLLQLLQGIGLRSTPEPLSEHTMRIINFPGLMADLRPYLQARLDKRLRHGLRFEQSGPRLGATQEDRLTIAHGQDRLDLSGAAMTRLVMGSPEEGKGISFSIPGSLAEAVSALFPLPSFLPGLNYQ
jgi:GNAT superfamily N-acetyltransferase